MNLRTPIRDEVFEPTFSRRLAVLVPSILVGALVGVLAILTLDPQPIPSIDLTRLYVEIIVLPITYAVHVRPWLLLWSLAVLGLIATHPILPARRNVLFTVIGAALWAATSVVIHLIIAGRF
jgi:hypothetical protein